MTITSTTDIELPYITTGDELRQATVAMAHELLWRIVGYDERPATEDDFAIVLRALTDARSQFVRDATRDLWPEAVVERPHLHVVEDAV